MDTRQHILQTWLKNTCKLQAFTLQMLPGDASFRRYFRVNDNGMTSIAMDAPPERENCRPFVAISRALRTRALLLPEIKMADLDQGFLLMTDFGNRQYLQELNSANAERLYTNALDALAILQGAREVDGWKVPLFTADFMYQELLLFQEWFLQKYLNLTLSNETQKMLAACYRLLADAAANQPQVFMHRDFHSANLMRLPDDQVGILDFQDAFIGPVTYDLVSLLRDCYIDWPATLVRQLVLYYFAKLQLNVSETEFLRWFDWMGLQRHMKALLTFSRKQLRDGNSNYIKFIPRTLNYIATVSQYYPEFKIYHQFLREVVLPVVSEVGLCAE